MGYEQDLRAHYDRVSARLNGKPDLSLPPDPEQVVHKDEVIDIPKFIEPPKAVDEGGHIPETVGHILMEVENKTGITKDALLSNSRIHLVIVARREAMYELHERLGMRFDAIAALFKLRYGSVLLNVRQYCRDTGRRLPKEMWTRKGLYA